jgi:hypothetical protein
MSHSTARHQRRSSLKVTRESTEFALKHLKELAFSSSKDAQKIYILSTTETVYFHRRTGIGSPFHNNQAITFMSLNTYLTPMFLNCVQYTEILQLKKPAWNIGLGPFLLKSAPSRLCNGGLKAFVGLKKLILVENAGRIYDQEVQNNFKAVLLEYFEREKERVLFATYPRLCS